MSNGIFTPDPGTVESMKCDVCGDKMEVIRGASGPTSWAGAMARSSRLHDKFTCANREEDWHKQSNRLIQEASKTPSRILSDLFEKEAKELIKTRIATKKVSVF